MMCNKCKGISKVVLGALLLLNAYLWPMWLGVDGWITWIAILMVLGGFVKIVVPPASCCKAASMPEPSKPAKKKR